MESRYMGSLHSTGQRLRCPIYRGCSRIARQTLTGCPHGTYDKLMERLEAMRDLRHRAGHFEAIARRALELLESGEWQEPEGPGTRLRK